MQGRSGCIRGAGGKNVGGGTRPGCKGAGMDEAKEMVTQRGEQKNMAGTKETVSTRSNT